MNASLQSDTFLRARLRQPTDHTPQWLTRQAVRYLPKYRATRVKAGNSFTWLATNPKDATQMALQLLDRYSLDAAILFNDNLTVPDAMSQGLSFGVGEGPHLAHPLRDVAAVNALQVPDLAELCYASDAVTSIRKGIGRLQSADRLPAARGRWAATLSKKRLSATTASSRSFCTAAPIRLWAARPLESAGGAGHDVQGEGVQA